MKKVLIVRMSSLGDILHSSYLVENLLRVFPGVEIDWVVESRFHQIVSQFKGIRHIFAIPLRFSQLNAIKQQINAMRQEQYDAVIDPQGLLKSGLVCFLARASLKIGYARPESREFSWLFYTKKVHVDHLINIVSKNLALLEPLGVTGKALPVSLKTNQEDKNYVSKHLQEKGLLGEPFILVNPWAAFPTKKIPIENTKELIHQLKKSNRQPILMSGPDDWEEAKALSLSVSCPLQMRTNLLQLISLIKECESYIGADSGPSYLSAILGKPTTILFGPTTALRQAPKMKNLESFYSEYQCPIIHPGEIKTPYRCLNKSCQDPRCMSEYKMADVTKKHLGEP